MSKRSPSRHLSWFSRIGLRKEIEGFLEGFAALVAAGLPITQALRTNSEEARSKSTKRIIASIQTDIERGVSLWEAFGGARLFSEEYVALIRVGEESGNLRTNLEFVVQQQRRNQSFRSKIYSGMLYPALVMGLALVVGGGVVIFVLPRLARVFSQLDIPLPFMTRALLGLGSFIGNEGIWVIPSFFAFALIVLIVLFGLKATKFLGHWLLLKIPGVGRFLEEIEVARFGYTLGTLLEGGVPVLEALGSLESVSPLRPYQKFFRYLHGMIQEGESFANSFKTYRGISSIIPPSVQQLIMTGEQSGKLSEMLLNIGKNYEEKINLTAKNITIALEPILLVTVWIGVLFVALAVIVPIYSLVGGIS